MSFQALQSLAKLQDFVGRRRAGLREQQGRELGQNIRNLFFNTLHAELQNAVVPKELILELCKFCTETTRSQFLGFQRHALHRMVVQGLNLAPLKVIQHYWNEKNGKLWTDELRGSIQAAGEKENLRLRLRNGTMLPVTHLESEWITWKDFPASLFQISTSFEECAVDPIEDLKQALPPELRTFLVQFQYHQEQLLGQRLCQLSYLLCGNSHNTISFHKANDMVIGMLLVLRPRDMMTHCWNPVQHWLRWRFDVTSEVLTRIFTVAAKVVNELITELDRSFVKVPKPAVSQMQDADITDLKQEIRARRHSAMLKEEKLQQQLAGLAAEPLNEAVELEAERDQIEGRLKQITPRRQLESLDKSDGTSSVRSQLVAHKQAEMAELQKEVDRHRLEDDAKEEPMRLGELQELHGQRFRVHSPKVSWSEVPVEASINVTEYERTLRGT